MKLGNLSKLVKGKLLKMFSNIVIKNGLNQYRSKCGAWEVGRKPLKAVFLMPSITRKITQATFGPYHLFPSDGNWIVKAI